MTKSEFAKKFEEATGLPLINAFVDNGWFTFFAYYKGKRSVLKNLDQKTVTCYSRVHLNAAIKAVLCDALEELVREVEIRDKALKLLKQARREMEENDG